MNRGPDDQGLTASPAQCKAGARPWQGCDARL